jgi:hypothetical protein
VLPHRTPATSAPRVAALREWASAARGRSHTRRHDRESREDEAGRTAPQAEAGSRPRGLMGAWAEGLMGHYYRGITVFWATPRAMALLALGPAPPLFRMDVVCRLATGHDNKHIYGLLNRVQTICNLD